MTDHLRLYTREKCPLCDKAKLVLEELQAEEGWEFETIDIYTDDELLERYGLMIPVIEWGEEIIQYGLVEKQKLIQKIKNKTW